MAHHDLTAINESPAMNRACWRIKPGDTYSVAESELPDVTDARYRVLAARGLEHEYMYHHEDVDHYGVWREVGHEQLEDLGQEAAEAGDEETAQLCRWARHDFMAKLKVALILQEAADRVLDP